jgi:hypothetical protein
MPSAEEHYRYILLLEDQNAEMRAMVEARNVTIKSISAENQNLRAQLAEASVATDELHRELDQARHALRIVRGAVNEHRTATLGGAPEKPQHTADTPIHRLRDTASL